MKMVAKSKTRLSTVEEAASGSEDDLIASSTIAPKRRTATSVKKPSKTSNTTREEPKAATNIGTKRKAPPAKRGRPALKDKTNVQNPKAPQDDGIGDDFDDIDAMKPKRAKISATMRASAAKRQPRTKREVETDVPVNSEIQSEPLEVSESIEVAHEPENPIDVADPGPLPDLVRTSRAPSLQPLLPRPSARSLAVQPLHPRPRARSISTQIYPYSRERSGSITSDAGRGRRGGDPELRRQFNELTRKNEDLSLKYENLRNIGVDGAETNFEKLRRITEEKAQDANNLIASLKKEIAELRKKSDTSTAVINENAALQRQVASLAAQNTTLVSERDEARTARDEDRQKLSVAVNEVKSLEAKLVTARQQLSNSAAEEKASKTANRNATSNASDEVKDLKMKENLYSDLTGLIVRSVKHRDGEDEYDCIQTGRNGTLHFHLTVANDTQNVNPQTPSGSSWESAEFAYDPFLDENRDRSLLDILPDYLTDGIAFPRSDAVKFYTKVFETMTQRMVVDDD